MLLAEDEVLEFVQIQLLHIDLLLASTLRMVVLFALGVVTFHSCPAARLVADETLITEPTSFDVFDALHADGSVLLLEVALGHPDGTDVVHPDIVAHWNIGRVGRFHKIVVVALFLPLSSFSHYPHDLF